MVAMVSRAVGLVALLSLASCSTPAAPPPIEPAAERAAGESDGQVVVEGDLPRPEPSSDGAPSKTAPGQSSPPTASPGFKLRADFSALSIDGRGDELYAVLGRFASDSSRVARVTRSGEQLDHRGPRGGRVHVLPGTPEMTVVTGDEGGLAIYENGRWHYRLAPALEGEAIAGVARSPDGRLWAAGVEHAVYELSGDDWRTHRLPSSGNSIAEVILARDGTLFLFGRHGRVITFKGGTFRDEKIADLGTGPFVSTWVDHKRGEVWLAGAKEITKVSLAAKMALVVPSPLFFDVSSIAGADTAKGSLLLATTFGRVALFDGTDWSLVRDDGANGAYLDPVKGQVYLLAGRGVEVHDVKHPWLGTGPPIPFTR